MNSSIWLRPGKLCRFNAATCQAWVPTILVSSSLAVIHSRIRPVRAPKLASSGALPSDKKGVGAQCGFAAYRWHEADSTVWSFTHSPRLLAGCRETV